MLDIISRAISIILTPIIGLHWLITGDPPFGLFIAVVFIEFWMFATEELFELIEKRKREKNDPISKYRRTYP